MRVVIAGAGDVGFQLSRRLSGERHDVVLIENDREQVRRAGDQLDVLPIHGNGASPDVLTEAGTQNSDLFVGVTSSDEVNILACALAKQLGAAHAVARVRNPEYVSRSSPASIEKLGIDLVIQPELEAAAEIAKLLETPPAVEVVEFADGRIRLVGLLLGRDSPLLGQTLREVDQNSPDVPFTVAAILRARGTIIPKGDDSFQPGDRVFFVAERRLIPALLELAGASTEKTERVMILGGGKIGRRVAAEMERTKTAVVKLIESNREKSVAIAEQLDRTLVLQADGTDMDLLAREGILEMDSFVAVTNDDQTNILACLLAKHLRVKKAIALLKRPTYMPLMPSIGLDATVSPIHSTISAIMRFIRRGQVVAEASLKDTDAEALELIALPNSKVVGKPLRELRGIFPRGMVVGALLHGHDIIIPTGDTVIREGDKAIVFALRSTLPDVEKAFS